MMLMGDEYGHTRHGNNNSYGHDTCINNFQWGQVMLFCFSITNVLTDVPDLYANLFPSYSCDIVGRKKIWPFQVFLRDDQVSPEPPHTETG